MIFFIILLTKLLSLYILYIYSDGGERVTIKINNRSGEPIYQQLYNAIKEAVISGAVQENEPLPSIRAIAKDLRISVITSKRAYDDLERDGYIYTIAGKGSFASARNIELIREENLKKIEALIKEAIRLADETGIEYFVLHEIMRILEEN